MSLRVDLLREDEVRYQGAVSRRFALRAGISGAVAALSIFLAYFFYTEFSVRRELRDIDERWAQVSDRHKALKEKRITMSSMQGLQKELGAWGRNRLDWVSRLDELEAMIPLNVQLVRFTVRDEWEFVRPPPPPPKPGEEAKPPPSQPARRTYLNISGRAAGANGEDAVIQVVTKMRNTKSYAGIFETIRLQRINTDPQPGDVADRAFDIEAAMAQPRKLE